MRDQVEDDERFWAGADRAGPGWALTALLGVACVLVAVAVMTSVVVFGSWAGAW